jgi:hypothetical protein
MRLKLAIGVLFLAMMVGAVTFWIYRQPPDLDQNESTPPAKSSPSHVDDKRFIGHWRAQDGGAPSHGILFEANGKGHYWHPHGGQADFSYELKQDVLRMTGIYRFGPGNWTIEAKVKRLTDDELDFDKEVSFGAHRYKRDANR